MPTDENLNGAEMPQVENTPPVDPIVNSIAEKLVENEKTVEASESEAPKAVDPLAIDFSKLSARQIQDLQRQFESTPFSRKKEDSKPTLTLREVNEKLIIAFGKARLQKTENELGQTVYRQFIPVTFENGEEEIIPYRDFMKSPRVECEIVKAKSEKIPVVEGSTFSQEEKREIEMVRMDEVYSFLIKLPSGKTIEIEGNNANG